MQITPFILGSGRAAQAIERSLAILGTLERQWIIAPPIRLARGQSLEGVARGKPLSLLCIANPPGLHAQSILAGERAGFERILVEKPACVTLEEVRALEAVRVPVAVCHVYRQMWGVQTLKKMIREGELGQIIAIEGRYWQASAALRATGEVAKGGWKNDASLNGPYDALLDVGTHWTDSALYLLGEAPTRGSAWLSYACSEAPHRDTHVQLSMDFASGARVLASISKLVHGATNHFELNVLGTQGSATWNFLNPDIIELGNGGTLKFLRKGTVSLGSGQPAFHGLGWLEGYVEILRRLVGASAREYPTLAEHRQVVSSLLNAAIVKSPAP